MCLALESILKDTKERKSQLETLPQVHPMPASAKRTMGCVTEVSCYGHFLGTNRSEYHLLFIVTWCLQLNEALWLPWVGGYAGIISDALRLIQGWIKHHRFLLVLFTVQ